MKIYDLSRSISKNEPIYPGNQPVKLESQKKFHRDGSMLSSITFGLHTATHLDGPAHYTRSQKYIDQIPLENCLGWCRVANLTRVKNTITKSVISKIKPRPGEILLLKTKNSLHQRKKFDKNFVHIDEGAADVLIKHQVKAVGIDGPSIRKFRLKPDRVHPKLLEAGILIYEGLGLKSVPAGKYYFFGLPLKIKNSEASPVRAIAIKA